MSNFSHSSVFYPAHSTTHAASTRISTPRTPVMKRMDPRTARALECLAHAMEYVEDTTLSQDDDTHEGIAALDAICLLKTLNRRIFAELPDLPERRSLARLMLDAWERLEQGLQAPNGYQQ